MSLGQENSSLGAPFALVRIFGIQQTISLVFIPKILTNTKFPPQILELDSNIDSIESSLRENKRSEFSWQSNKNKYARSANPCKSFCYFWLSPKVESPSTSSLRGRIVDSHEAIQKISQPNLARFVVLYKNLFCLDCHESANADSRNDGVMAFETLRNAKNPPTKDTPCFLNS